MWVVGLDLGTAVLVAIVDEEAVVGWRNAGLVTEVVVAVEVSCVEDAAAAGLDIPVTGLGACKDIGFLEAARSRVCVVAVLVAVPGFAAVLVFVPVVVAVPVVEIEDAGFSRL